MQKVKYDSTKAQQDLTRPGRAKAEIGQLARLIYLCTLTTGILRWALQTCAGSGKWQQLQLPGKEEASQLWERKCRGSALEVLWATAGRFCERLTGALMSPTTWVVLWVASEQKDMDQGLLVRALES